MTNFYICRHGETENNRKKLFQGWIDTPLTDEGNQNALSSASKLQDIEFDRIIASDLGRAFITAYTIGRELGYSNEIERNSGLREVNYGDFANQPYSVYPELTPTENASFILPNGESLEQMQQRVIKCVRSIANVYVGKTILLVAHDGTINSLRAWHGNENIGTADLTRNAHDSIHTFGIKDSSIVYFEQK